MIDREPDWAALPDTIPPVFSSFLNRCLQKNPKKRIRDIGDVRLAMEGAFETTVSALAEPSRFHQLQVWRRPLPAAIVAAAIAGLAVWALTRPEPTPAPDLVRFTIVPPDTAPLDLREVAHELAISTDGTQVVYQSRGGVAGTGLRLNLRPLDQLVGTPVQGTDGAAGPFMSPDGEWVGFIRSARGTTLQKVPIFGAPTPVMLTEAPSVILGASWGADDQIIFGTTSGGLFRVSGSGGEPEALTTLDTEQGENSHRWPSIIPGRRTVLFASGAAEDFLTSGRLAALDLDTGEVTRLGLAGVSPQYVSTGHLVYAAEDGSVRAVSFNATTLEVTGNPVLLVEGVVVKSSGAANFTISDDGRLVYVAGVEVPAQLTLVWVDRQGRTEVLDTELRDYLRPRLSPDGMQVAVDIVSADGSFDIWVAGLERGTLSRLTVEGSNEAPIWTPDGTRVVFASGRPGSPDRDIYWAPADRSGDAEPLLIRDHAQYPYSWSRDARLLAFSETHPTTGRDIWVLPIDGEPQPFLVTSFDERAPTFSPDGRWLAYVSNESRREEVYVQAYPGPGPRVQISVNGGREPVWSADGTELFFRSLDGTDIMVVAVESAAVFAAEDPRLLFQGEYARSPMNNGRPYYDVSSDGERFLMLEDQSEGDDSSPPVITVVLNWTQELLERVPVP